MPFTTEEEEYHADEEYDRIRDDQLVERIEASRKEEPMAPSISDEAKLAVLRRESEFLHRVRAEFSPEEAVFASMREGRLRTRIRRLEGLSAVRPDLTMGREF